MEKYKLEERKAILAMIFSQGAFKGAGKEDKEFRNFIIEEAKKRKIDNYELIDYFAENKKELLKILKNKDYKVYKKFRPFSRKESLIPKEISDISKKVNIVQLKLTDYVGKVESKEYGEMEKWQKEDIGYLVKSKDFIEKMNKQLPKVNANQDKNLKLLIYLLQKSATKKINISEATIPFYIKDYAKYMGYEEQIKKSSNVYIELKRTLISGACTIYEYPHLVDGVKYKYYGSFYDIDIPEDNKHKWTIYFHGLYGKQIIELINEGKGQYIKHLLKEIKDTKTTQKPYLHYFYNQMIFSNLQERTKQIRNILIDMGIKKDKLDRPKECFKILKDCLIYFNENYPEEIEGFYISKYYHKSKTGLKDKLLISISESFKEYEYEDFKDLLKAKDIKDIREAFIRFKKPYKPKYVKFELTEDDKELIEEIIKEAREWEENYNKIPFNEDQRYKFLADCIRYLGHIKLSDLYNNANNMMEFLTETLKGELKENKEEKLKLPI